MSRPPLARMLRLHQELAADRFPNCSRLGAELEVSPKTIQRDLEFMRDRLGLPIAYDSGRFGYRYTETVSQFPTLQVTEGELVALFIARKALAQYQGTSFEKPLEQAFSKITEGLREEVSVDFGSWEAYFSVRSLGLSVSDLELFEALSRAVRKSEEVRFEYKKLKSGAHETRMARPYHLSCVENQWYLFGFDMERQAIRTYALPRMRNLEATGRHFERPSDFSPDEFLSGSFGVFSGRASHAVRIRFDPFAAQLVRERRWHATQDIREFKDGSLELRMKLGGLEEVERWILSWGEHARVLSPPKLAQAIRATIARTRALYDCMTDAKAHAVHCPRRTITNKKRNAERRTC